MNLGRDIVIIVLVIVGLAIAFTAVRSVGTINPLIAPSFSLPTRGVAPVITPARNTEQTSTETQRQEQERTEEQERQMIEREIAEAQAEIAKIEEEIEYIEKHGERSPYQGLITLERGQARSTNVDSEYVEIRANRNNESRIVITDWTIKSEVTGRTVTVPEGVILLRAGATGSKSPVALDPGGVAYVITGRSPIGSSFRNNLCAGYFEQFQNFTPRIRTSCPHPEDEIFYYTKDRNIFIDNTCMDFVERIRRCTVQTKPLPLTLSPTCQEAIVDTISYNACVDHHKDSEGFYGLDWRLYLKRDSELWRHKRELIKLLDENGKTVDFYSF